VDRLAVDALRDLGAQVHLVHPLGGKAFEYRRVENDERDAIDRADLLRLGRLPEAWIAPPPTRELELARHRAKLVGLRGNCKAQIHGVLAMCGIRVSMSELPDLEGAELLDRLQLPKPCAARIAALRRLITDVDLEIAAFAGRVRARPARDPGFVAVRHTGRAGSADPASSVADRPAGERSQSRSPVTAGAPDATPAVITVCLTLTVGRGGAVGLPGAAEKTSEVECNWATRKRFSRWGGPSAATPFPASNGLAASSTITLDQPAVPDHPGQCRWC
jgi:hypothetical protein